MKFYDFATSKSHTSTVMFRLYKHTILFFRFLQASVNVILLWKFMRHHVPHSLPLFLPICKWIEIVLFL